MLLPKVSLNAQTSDTDRQLLLEHLTAPGASTGLVERMGIEFTGLGHDFIAARVPVEGNTQPMGLFHGGAHVVLAETMASMHSVLISGGKKVVGVDLNATHVRATTSGFVTGRAEVLHQGRTIVSHEVKMTDEADRLLSIVRITNMILSSNPA